MISCYYCKKYAQCAMTNQAVNANIAIAKALQEYPTYFTANLVCSLFDSIDLGSFQAFVQDVVRPDELDEADPCY